MTSMIALVPARSGSKRIPGKNIRELGGHPLLAYTVSAALESDVFDRVVCSTDSEEIAAVARSYGADVPFLRPPEYAQDTSPDFAWAKHALSAFPDCQIFAILRPTSPFRQPGTIRDASTCFQSAGHWADSLRAVEAVTQHPAKMWVRSAKEESRLYPLLPLIEAEGQPGHSVQYASLPEVFVQNGSLEFAWTDTVWQKQSIAGDSVMAYFMPGYEGFDLNTEEDWQTAERLVETEDILPRIGVPA